jgi:hypothetical protein
MIDIHRGVHSTAVETRDLRAHPPWRALAGAGLGVWLIVAAFVLPRPYDSRVNAFVVGALIAIAALTSVRQPLARHVVAALAAWLVLSAFALFFTGPAVLLHDLILAFAIFAIALAPAAVARRFIGRDRRLREI